jgi:dihydroneopterin aldolase
MISEIELKDIRFHAFHGVIPQERLTGNSFTVNIRLAAPLHKAVATDNPADTISYAEVFRLTAIEMNIASSLLEHVAGRIMTAIKLRFPQVTSLEVSVAKHNPPIAGADMDCAIVRLAWKA